MADLPSHIAARRSARRREIRRRRMMVLGALGALAAVIIVAVALLALGGGGSSTGRHASAGTGAAGSPRHGGAPRTAPATGALTGVEANGNARIRSLAQLGLPVYCGGGHGDEVAFTFDDGPGPYTHLALKKLTQAGERATFFVVGKSMASFPGYTPRELRVAAIGDHTMTHPVLPALSAQDIGSQISGTKRMIEAESGQSVDLMRPPYGSRNAVVDQTAKRLGLLDIIWTVDSADSLGADYAGIIRNVEAGLHPGSIILMHENRGQTIRALTTLLPVLGQRHLRSVSLPQLFADDPPTAAQVKAGPNGCGVAGRVPAGTGTSAAG